jgi:hypothetical protein
MQQVMAKGTMTLMLEEKAIEATLNQVLAQPGWGAWRVERFHLQDERHG